jgi:hypothetical protein
MSSSVILKATGLQTSPNELDRPDGALIEASNVIIKRDGIIEQRRGFSLYGTELPDTTARVKQLTIYRNRILRHFSNQLQFDSDGAGNFQTFSGNFLETQEGLRMKFIESNGNLYFTTDTGVKKISARTADDFTTDSGFVVSAGAVKAVDLTGKAIYTANSQAAWFPQDSAVAYRVLWAYTDLNNNLIQGAPSQRLVVSNPMIGLLIRDYTRLLSALDSFQSSTSTSRINDKNYVQTLGLVLNATASELYTNLLALTKKLDEDILYANQTGTSGTDTVPFVISSASIDSGLATVNLTGATTSNYFEPGSKIYLNGFNLTTQQEIQTVKFAFSQKISFSLTPTSGTFKLQYNSLLSANINWNDSAATVQSKLNVLTGLSNIVVTGTITSATGLTLSSIDGLNYPFTVDSNTLVSGVTPVAVSVSYLPLASGKFTLKYKTNQSADINWNDSAATIQTTLRAVSGLENVSVSGAINNTTGLTLTFPTSDGDLDQITEGTGNTLSPATKITTATTQKGIKEVIGKINEGQTIVSVEPTYITFNTDAIGAVSLSSATITSNEYRAITQPILPDVPATNDQLVDLQVYLEDIITRLSSEPDSVISSSQKITFDANPTSGTFTLKYNNIVSSPINATATALDVQNILNTINGLANIQVSGTINSSTGLTLSNVDGLSSAFTVNSNTLSPTTNISISTSDLLSLDDISITTTSTVELNITIPQGINPNYFFQVYRTSVAQATGVATFDELIPDEEYKLVYEAYPTNDELSASNITVEDVTPDAFRGANLYTNASTGEGILQSNEIPPLAKDVNRYRNSIFYANTRTRHQLLLSLLGVTNMIADSDAGNIPKITISNGTTSNTYTFVTGQQEITTVKVNSAASLLNSKYFLISSTETDYYVWFDLDDTGVDPGTNLIANPSLTGRTGIKVNVISADTANDVAQKIKNVLSTYLDDFIPTVSTDTVTITNYSFGKTTDATPGDSGFTVNIVADGRSEDVATNSVLLSTVISPSRAVDETARSLVRIINKNPNESVYAYYVSPAYDVPGKIFLQARELEQVTPFYVVGNNSVTGTSFNPDISPTHTITNISISDPTIITSSPAHNLLTGDQVIITNTGSTPSIDGLYSVTVINSTQFSIDVDVTAVPGVITGAFIKASNGTYSENEERANRVYYSKYQQPEAVPSVNYFDVGAQDKAILRILPLRTSLFVFKEDGLYRISGESAPFQLELFDISFIVLAPDSVSVSNNVIYAWTTQGIQSLTEGGASIISRSIDNIILRTQSSNFINFKTATWGVGYESDNSYLVYTVKNEEDEMATIAYRFSTLTNTWTTYNLGHVSGVVNSANDKLYISAADVAYIEQERKTFSRLDYADREIDSVLSANKLFSFGMVLPSITGITVGDVIIQDQTITTTNFNILLEKLDLDSGVSQNDFYSTLELIKGMSPRDQLEALAIKLDSDTAVFDGDGNLVSSGVSYSDFFTSIESKAGSIVSASAANPSIITTSVPHGLITGRIIAITGSNTNPSIDATYAVTVINPTTFSIPIKVRVAGTSGTWQTIDTSFDDLKVCYNYIVSTLNTDTGVSFNNYRPITNSTLMECIITEINPVTRRLTLNLNLDYLVGDVKVFKSFESSFAYSPITFGDPLLLKHLREATMMFETRTLTGGTLSFRTDLLPELIAVPFKLDGNGIFGHVNGFGDGLFGGLANAAPFRTYIPRQCQRCRYIIVRFSHSIAREDYRVNGCTLTGEIGQSSRAYR